MTHNDNALPDSSHFPHFGARLRHARESRKLSLEDISTRLRLHPSIIHQLETGDFKSSAPAIFLRGYLRSYARMMDFTEEDVQVALTESGFMLNPNAPLVPNPQSSSPDRPALISRLHWISMGILLTLAFIVFVWWNAYPVTVVREQLSAHILQSTAQETPEVPKAAEVRADNANISAGPLSSDVSDLPLILPSRFGIVPNTSDLGVESIT